jgi:cation diffusion facilitator CzcD-associated flavoprotein CzcO
MALDIGRRRLERAARAARAQGRPTPAVVIVGGGLSGLAAGMQLVRSGITTFSILEQSAGVGGTWRDNTYPGSACDVPSHLYSFSFFPKSDWSRRFADQPEILGYAEACVDHFGLGPHLRFGTTVERAHYDERDGRWHLSVSTASGPDSMTADAVIFACGQLNRPLVPDLEGLDGFAGPWWHSARWDHSVDLSGLSVGVVGSGASAIQFVPPVAAEAERLTIFQRSPNYVGPKKDRAYADRTHRLLERSGAVERAYRWWIYWTLEVRWLWFRRDSWFGRKLGDLFKKGIRNDVVSERLPEPSVVPDYPVGCKRILISNDWYPALLSEGVAVVDSPVVRVEPDAVVTADGGRHPVDVLIFGTGFSTTDFLAHIPVTGVGGATLASEWAEGARAYLGTMVAGFPNCYLLYGPNTNLGHNSILFMVERQLNLVLQALAVQTDAMPAAPSMPQEPAEGPAPVPRVEVDAEAYLRDDRRTQALMASTVWVSSCHSWYKAASGRVTNNWPTWTVRYWFDTLRLDRADLGLGPTDPVGPSVAPDPARNGTAPPLGDRATGGRSAPVH